MPTINLDGEILPCKKKKKLKLDISKIEKKSDGNN